MMTKKQKFFLRSKVRNRKTGDPGDPRGSLGILKKKVKIFGKKKNFFLDPFLDPQDPQDPQDPRFFCL